MLENVRLDRRAIFRDLTGRKKKDLLRALCLRAAEAYGLDGPGLFDEVWNREKLVPTCVGHNVALPHCRLRGIDEIFMSVAVWPKGVDMDSPGGDLVRIAVLVIAPREKLEADYLALLAWLARLLRKESNRDLLCSASEEDLLRWFEENAA